MCNDDHFRPNFQLWNSLLARTDHAGLTRYLGGMVFGRWVLRKGQVSSCPRHKRQTQTSIAKISHHVFQSTSHHDKRKASIFEHTNDSLGGVWIHLPDSLSRFTHGGHGAGFDISQWVCPNTRRLQRVAPGIPSTPLPNYSSQRCIPAGRVSRLASHLVTCTRTNKRRYFSRLRGNRTPWRHTRIQQQDGPGGPRSLFAYIVYLGRTCGRNYFLPLHSLGFSAPSQIYRPKY